MRELDDLSEEIGAVERLLLRELGDAIEGCSLLESVALLVSQRENARNAHAATQERCDKMEAALEPFASCHDGDLSQIGGGTVVSAQFKLQVFKDAKAAIGKEVK